MNAVIEVILPVFGLVALGYAATWLPQFDAAARRGLSTYVFYFALPVTLFRTASGPDAPVNIDWAFLAIYYLSTFGVLAIGTLYARYIRGRTMAEAVILGFAGSYSNMLLLGIPIILTTFGEPGTIAAFMLIAFHSVLLFPTITVLIEVNRGRTERLRDLPLNTLKGLGTNPILISLALGFLFGGLGLRLPLAIDTIAQSLAVSAVPCALFALGASMRQYKLIGGMTEALPFVLLKLIGLPAVTWLTAHALFDVDPLWVAVAVVVAGLPTGVNVYLFAERYQLAVAEAAQVSVLTTVGAVATLSTLIILYRP